MSELNFFTYYLIGINIIGFLSYTVNMVLYTYTEKWQIDIILTIVAIALGSPGILIAILLFDRHAKKENMMSRVFVACIFVIELLGFLYFKGFHNDSINISVLSFFSDHKFIIYYLLAINIITFIAFVIDKMNSIKHKSRIRIVTLLGLAFIGGSIGGLIAMYLFRHKTKKDYFTVGIPLILIMQICIIFFTMNNT